jgi:AsmA protein
MNRNLKIAAIIIGVLILIVIAIPFFIDANAFRPKLESELSDALGRPVKVGTLSLSLFSGAVKADDISIADDPAFSQTAFVQAKSLSVGVELIPLIFSKSLNVTELTLNQPEISLVRSKDGERWNFSSLGAKSSAKPTQPAPSGGASSNPNLSVSKLKVSDGGLTISRAGSSEKPRVYDKVDITVTNFSFTNSFPFKMTANLPGGGTLDLDGTAGPIDANNAALTPLQAKVTVRKMNLAASGFIDSASGIAGIADFDGTVSCDGHEAKTVGTLDVERLQVVQKGAPAGRPVQVKYSVTYDLAKQTGAITQGEIALGKALEQITGT